jgi:hypothetical protein
MVLNFTEIHFKPDFALGAVVRGQNIRKPSIKGVSSLW